MNIVCLFFIAFSNAAFVFLSNARNDWYANFYQAIGQRESIVSYVGLFLLLAFIISINNIIKNYLKIKFVAKGRKESLLTQHEKTDCAQKVCEEKTNYLKNIAEFWDALFLGIGLFLVFIPKIFYVASSIASYVFFIFLIYMFVSFFINFGYLKKLQKNFYYKHQMNEAKLRKFLTIWFNKKCIKPIDIKSDYFKSAVNSMQNFDLIKAFIEEGRGFYESIGMIIPFVIFYSSYLNNTISFAIFMQLVNLWVQITFGAKKIAESIEYYNEYAVAKYRFKNNYKNQIKTSNSIILKNIIIYAKNKKLIDNFSLQVDAHQKVIIVASNKSGKTTLMNAMQGVRSFEGEIYIPKKTLFIPENPLMPHKTIISSSLEFKSKCKIFDINSNLFFEDASGAEKWKLLAAYASCFDFVVWDDPFWGISDIDAELELLLQNINGALFFSIYPINGTKIVEF